MPQNMTTVLYALLMVIVIVGLDLTFFRDLFWERLLSNVGVVLVFAAATLRDEAAASAAGSAR
jgi:type IV secretory pathway VirB2 component (pilin)